MRLCLPVVKPVRYVFTVVFHYFRGGRDVYVFDLIGVLFGPFVGEQVKRFQQRPRLDHFQQLNDFLSKKKNQIKSTDRDNNNSMILYCTALSTRRRTFSLTTESFSNSMPSMLSKLTDARSRSAKSYDVCKNDVTDARKSMTDSPSPGYHLAVARRSSNRELNVFAAVTLALSYPSVFLRN